MGVIDFVKVNNRHNTALTPPPDEPRPSPHRSMAARTREIPSTKPDGWHAGNPSEGPEARARTGEWPGETRRDPRDGPTYR